MVSIKQKYSREKVQAIYEDLRNERSEWEAEWRSISSNILPGRGVYQLYSKPAKRKLTSKKIINTIAREALQVLVAGIHGSLTSPAMIWTRLSWPDPRMNEIEYLKSWLQECEKILHAGFHDSNFYSALPSFYTEYAGFGTACMYVGEDSEDSPFRFELLTAGEYAFSTNSANNPDIFCRTIFMSARQLVHKFGDSTSKQIRQDVEDNRNSVDTINLALIEFIAREDYQDKNFVRLFYEVTEVGTNRQGNQIPGKLGEKPLSVEGFYEFPYPIARWSTIGSDVYGIGAGSEAIQDVLRLQEMEKAFLLAAHKSINPPLNVPSRLTGKVNSLPGAFNYYGSNPTQVITPLYQVNFDFSSTAAAVERVEHRIQKIFYNDVFLTASRDPNASPLKATQVNAQEQEKLFRLGPVTQRLTSEFLVPVIRRCFNIMYRKGLFPDLDPQYKPFVDNFKVDLISPMATAQNAARSQGTQSFMSFLGAAAQFDPSILDNINIDKAARQSAEIEGVDLGILRSEDEVAELRKKRAEAQAAEQQRKTQMEASLTQAQGQQASSASRKMEAESGQILAETQQTNLESGI